MALAKWKEIIKGRKRELDRLGTAGGTFPPMYLDPNLDYSIKSPAVWTRGTVMHFEMTAGCSLNFGLQEVKFNAYY